MKIVLAVIAGLLLLLGAGYAFDNKFFTGQIAYILIFALIFVGGLGLLKFIQKHY
ncbi:MAG: hypothetical protein AAF204_02340 [Pseudomonadota bacterium]